LDLKADGGYVLLPPSLHPSGRCYTWEVSCHPDEVPIAVMPDWLLDMLRPAATSPEKSEGCHTQSVVRLPVGRRTLAFIAQGAPIGEQRLRAVAAARNLLSAGYSVEAVADAIWQGLQASDWDPSREPWTEQDALKIVADLARKPPHRCARWSEKQCVATPPDFSGEVAVGGSRFRIVYEAPDFSGEVKPLPKNRYPVIQKLSVEVGA
jgi:hypothetical protein